MILDFIPQTGAFTLTVPRATGDIRTLMQEHGLDLSLSASTPDEACLFTRESYAAVGFWQYATDRAAAQLLELQQVIESSWAIDSGAHIKCPADQELSLFQKAGVEYALRRKNTLIGDQPGLGKTMQAICFANEIGAKRVLCLVPANIRLQWVNKIRQWTTMKWPFTVYPILHGRHGVHPDAAWTIVSYDLARTAPIWRALAKGRYDLLILDEGHYLKTVDALRTRTVFGGGDGPVAASLASRADAILDLTGTPLPNRPREAYTAARGLCLGQDTRVLTNSGLRAIVDVRPSDLLWDGVNWVPHGGVICKGYKTTSRVMGLTATPDHQVLSGGRWNTWQDVQGDAYIRSRALATGLGSLQSLAMSLDQEASVLRCSAPADARLIASPPPIFVEAALSGASSVEIVSSAKAGPINNTLKSFLTGPYGTAFSRGLMRSLAVVSGPQTPDTNGMESEAFEFGQDGFRTAKPFLLTSLLCRTVGGLDMSLIVATMIEDTSRAIFAGCRALSTLETNAQSLAWSERTESFENVYDILNSGPLQRFTILTEAGPLLVHNCFEAIDFMSEDRFQKRFNPSVTRETPDGKIYIDERSGRHGELQARLRSNFMVRRLKRDVQPQLKLPLIDIVHVEETAAVRQALNAEKLLDINPEELSGIDAEILGQISTVRREMGLAIAPLAADYAEMVLDGGEEKLFLVAYHTQVLDILEKKLHRFAPLRIDGSTPPSRRQKIVDLFGQPGRRLLIGQLLAVGTGTDGLQHACSRGVVAEPDWVHGNNEQVVNRLDRMGQKDKVLFDFLVAQGSFSERVLGTALRKGQVVDRVLDRQM